MNRFYAGMLSISILIAASGCSRVLNLREFDENN